MGMMRVVAVLAVLLSAATAAAQTVLLPVSDRTGRLTVRVADRTSLAVPGASVYLRSGPGQARLDVLTFSSSTGYAYIEGLPVGRYKLVVNLGGFHEWRQIVHVFPGDDQTIDIALQVNPHACVVVDDHGSPTGSVRDVNGRAVPRMVLVAEHDYWPTTYRVSSNGTFGWCGPPSSFYEVSVVFEPVGRVLLKPAREEATTETWRRTFDIQSVQDAARSSLLTRAQSGAAPATPGSRGKVVDGQGGLIPGATVSFINLRSSTDGAVTVLSDERGEFDLPRVHDGFYRVTITLPGFVDGVAYWQPGESAPVMETHVASIAECVALAPLIDFLLIDRHGAPLAGAHLKTVEPDGATSTLMQVREGRPHCFTPSASQELRLDIEGLGEMLLKPAGVDPRKMPPRISIDWTALVARRLRTFRR